MCTAIDVTVFIAATSTTLRLVAVGAARARMDFAQHRELVRIGRCGLGDVAARISPSSRCCRRCHRG